MSTPAVEATMPAQPTHDLGEVTIRPAATRPMVRTACTSAPAPIAMVRPSPEGLGRSEIETRLIAANQRAAELEEQLAAAIAERDAAEHQAAQLEDRNRELASDLDDALDQLAGHALHSEQERLIRTPAWSPWAASADREGMQR
ncbi:hypothetical protein [Nocardia nova]|uniref:Uncharacterized protein n=1 Tax=Nocardia nova TaxID=37330 RepID=A0A2S6A510_9NOCA|nr:hypothetical protein [Nocardia nova]PPJ27230.1 hypothetical protein C5F51_18485 [Nocardia nova]